MSEDVDPIDVARSAPFLFVIAVFGFGMLVGMATTVLILFL